MIKILVIDDSVFSQRIAEKFLKKHIENADISYAANGLAGLEKYKEINPDYICVDLLMPIVSGIEFISRIEEADRSKIIVVSADVQNHIKEEIEQYHVLSFINKPLDDEKAEYISELIRNDGNGRK